MNKMKLVIKNATIIDGRNGSERKAMDIVVEGSRISHVKPTGGEELVDAQSIIDASGKYVMPGIIDCHLHLSGISDQDPLHWIFENNLQQAMISIKEMQEVLLHGITSVCDVSRNGMYLKNVVAESIYEGPNILSCGVGLCRTGGYSDSQGIPPIMLKESHPWATFCDGEDEIIKSVRRLIRENVDGIKVWATGGGVDFPNGCQDQHFSMSELKTVVNEAEFLGIPVFAHCESLAGTKAALKAGIKRIVHGEDLDDECVELMLEKEAFYIPTLKLNLEWYNYYPENMEQEDIKRELQRTLDSFHKALEAGVSIAVGSDTFCRGVTPYGKFTLSEIKTLVKYGMSIKDVIVAATSTGAAVMNRPGSLGVIEEGKIADMILMHKNPLEEISHLDRENFMAVISKGKLV